MKEPELFRIVTFTCDLCRHYGPVLSADNSYNEYAPARICQDCINDLFKVFAKESDQE